MNILLTGAFNYLSEQLDEIKSLGYNIFYHQDERTKINFNVSKIDVVVCNNLFLHNDIKEFKNLKMIQVTSAGLDRLPLEYIKDNNIKLFNARGVYSKPIAEWVVLKILEVYKKTSIFIKQQESKEWIKQRSLRELTNKNVAILGYGDIGNEIAKRLKAFDANIYAFDLVEPKTTNHYKYDHVSNVDSYLEDLDIVVSSLPLTEETEGFIDYTFLNKMKPDALLVNISRGKVINEIDLTNHLLTNQNFYAILDVFENEPLENDSKLWGLNNIVITPHNSYVSNDNKARLFELIKLNIRI